MARPRIYHEPRVVTAVRLPIDLRNRLDSVARTRRTSVNALVNRAVTDLLDDFEAGPAPATEPAVADAPVAR